MGVVRCYLFLRFCCLAPSMIPARCVIVRAFCSLINLRVSLLGLCRTFSVSMPCVAALCCFFLPGKQHICRPTLRTSSLHALPPTPLHCCPVPSLMLSNVESSSCLFPSSVLVFVVSPNGLCLSVWKPQQLFSSLSCHCHHRNCCLFCASVCCCHSHTNSPQCSSIAVLFGCDRRRRLPGPTDVSVVRLFLFLT